MIISSIDGLLKELNNFNNHWIFRGHNNSNWELQSTLERILGNKWCSELAKKSEVYSYSIFKSRTHHYISKELLPNTKLEWLALMQHYGVPTRLLDFTESPYVALFFAISGIPSDQNDNFTIWCLDYRKIMKRSIDIIKTYDREFTYDYNYVFQNQDALFESLVDRFSYDILWVAEPSRLNIRLERQMGTFLISGNPEIKINELLNNGKYDISESVVRLDIDINLKDNVFALLNKMNMTNSSLFNNLDGVAKDIKDKLVFFSA